MEVSRQDGWVEILIEMELVVVEELTEQELATGLGGRSLYLRIFRST